MTGGHNKKIGIILALALTLLIVELFVLRATGNNTKVNPPAKTSTATPNYFPVPPNHPNVVDAGITYTFKGVVDTITSNSLTLKSDNDTALPRFYFTSGVQVIRKVPTATLPRLAMLKDITPGTVVFVTTTFSLPDNTWSTIRIAIDNSVQK